MDEPAKPLAQPHLVSAVTGWLLYTLELPAPRPQPFYAPFLLLLPKLSIPICSDLREPGDGEETQFTGEEFCGIKSLQQVQMG